MLDLLEKINNQTTAIQLMLTEILRGPIQIHSETIKEIKHQNLDPKQCDDRNKSNLNKQTEEIMKIEIPKVTTEPESEQKSICYKSWFCWKKRRKNRSLSNEIVKKSSDVSVRPYLASITSLPTEEQFSKTNSVHKNEKYSSTGGDTKSATSIDPITDLKIKSETQNCHGIPVDSLLHYKILLQISQTVDSLDAFIKADLTNNQERVDDIVAAAQVFYGRINQIQASTFPLTDYQQIENAAIAASIVATSVETTQSHADEISPLDDGIDCDAEASENQNLIADVTVQMNVARIFAMCPTNETALSSNTRASCQNHMAPQSKAYHKFDNDFVPSSAPQIKF